MQLVETMDPWVIEYLPRGQRVQLAAFIAPNKVEYEPTWQEIHIVDPTVVEYFPCSHSVQYSIAVAPNNME